MTVSMRIVLVCDNCEALFIGEQPTQGWVNYEEKLMTRARASVGWAHVPKEISKAGSDIDLCKECKTILSDFIGPVPEVVAEDDPD
jgi:hypothetical protein